MSYLFEKDSLHYLCLMRAITDPTKKSVRQTARRQMSEARHDKRSLKKIKRKYDKLSGGYTNVKKLVDGEVVTDSVKNKSKRDAYKSIRSKFRENKKMIKGMKRAILNNI